MNKKAPELKVPVLTFSRVCGYFSPVSQWNKAKQSEFRDRKEYIIDPNHIKMREYGR